MSFIAYSPMPRSATLSTRSALPSSQSGAVEAESPRSGLGSSRCEGGAFQFPPDFTRFAPMQGLASALYGLPYINHAGPQAPPIFPALPTAIDASALQAPLNPVEPKDISSAWRGHPIYPYDPSLASLVYPGGYSALGLADGARRKNATRETTSTLKAWLNDHRKNPYPTKGEKIMLAIVSKMTLTQVSTWFANARRRLKKENRMTWSPRNRCGEERDSDDDADSGNVSSPLPSSLDLSQRSPLNKNDVDSESRRSEMGGMAYQHYHQQMLLRHLASLPPHQRTLDSFKQYQEQFHSRPSWRPSIPSEPSMSTRDRLSSSASRSPTHSAEQNRRNSVGSPSVSSHDRSPSPPHRPPHHHLVLTEQPNRSPSPKSREKTPQTKCKVEHDQSRISDQTIQSKLNKSSSSPNSKLTIWSPANLALDKSSSKNLSSSNENSSTGLSSSSAIWTPSSDQDKKSDRVCSENNDFSRKSNASDSSSSSPLNSPVASAWMQKYCPPFSSHLPIQHSALAATMEYIAATGRSHQHLLDSVKRQHGYHSYQSRLLLSELPSVSERRKCDQGFLRHDEEDVSDQDVNIPMNLSKPLPGQNEAPASSEMADKKGILPIVAK